MRGPRTPRHSAFPALIHESVGLESVSEVLAAAPIVAVGEAQGPTAFSVPTLVCIDSVGLDRVSAPEDSPKSRRHSAFPHWFPPRAWGSKA